MSDPIRTLTPIERRPTTDVIVDELRERIVDGTLTGGTQLAEVALAEQLGVSRGPVREAMQRLIQEGLLVAERYRGVFVVELDADDVADVYVARAAVERAAAAEVVRRADPEVLADLEGLVGKMAAAATKRTSWRRLVELDLSYHETLVAGAGSRRLARMYDTLVAETRLCFVALEADYPDWNDIVAEHQRLLAALRAGDEDKAVAAVDDHLHLAAARRRAVEG